MIYGAKQRIFKTRDDKPLGFLMSAFGRGCVKTAKLSTASSRFIDLDRVLADNFSRRTDLSHPDCCDEWFDTHDDEEALDIISQDGEAHLCGDVFNALGEEVARSHPAF